MHHPPPPSDRRPAVTIVTAVVRLSPRRVPIPAMATALQQAYACVLDEPMPAAFTDLLGRID